MTEAVGRDAYEEWFDESLAATSHARGLASAIRTIVWVVAGLFALGFVMSFISLANDDDGDPVEVVFILTSAIAGAVGLLVISIFVLAIASALDMLRIQTQAVLFDSDDDEDAAT